MTKPDSTINATSRCYGPTASQHSTRRAGLKAGSIGFGLWIVMQAACSQPSQLPDPRLELDYLSTRIQIASRTGKTWAEQRELERAVAQRIQRMAEESPEDPMLTQKGGDEMFPLAQAAFNGYALVVEALLKSEAVRRQVNDRAPGGATPLALALLARPLTFWACEPNMPHTQLREFRTAALLRKDYALRAPDQPFKRIRSLLLEAGAVAPVDDLKMVWGQRCPASKEGAVLLTGDESDTERLIKLSEQRWDEARRSTVVLPSEPVEAMKWEHHERRQRQPAPTIDQDHRNDPDRWNDNRICRVTAKPNLDPAWPWTGSAHIRASVRLQDGVPMDVRIQRISGDMSATADKALARLMARTFSAFECRGERTVAMDFELRHAP